MYGSVDKNKCLYVAIMLICTYGKFTSSNFH